LFSCPTRRSSDLVFVYSRALLRQGVSLPKGMRTPTSFMPVSWHGCGPPLWGWRGPASDGSSGCHVVQVEDLVLRGFRPLFECLQAVVVGGRTDRQSEAVVLEAGLVLLRVLTQNLLRQRGVRLGDRDLVQAVTVEALDGHLRVELLAGTEDHGDVAVQLQADTLAFAALLRNGLGAVHEGLGLLQNLLLLTDQGGQFRVGQVVEVFQKLHAIDLRVHRGGVAAGQRSDLDIPRRVGLAVSGQKVPVERGGRDATTRTIPVVGDSDDREAGGAFVLDFDDVVGPDVHVTGAGHSTLLSEGLGSPGPVSTTLPQESSFLRNYRRVLCRYWLGGNMTPARLLTVKMRKRAGC